MIKQLKFQRLLAMLYIGTAVGITHYWWQFFFGSLLVEDNLQVLNSHSKEHLLRERLFIFPDIALALGMFVSSISLWTNRWLTVGRAIAFVCAVVGLLLGSLDLNYGFSSGLFKLDHGFADVSLEVALSVTAVGFVALIILFFAPRSEQP